MHTIIIFNEADTTRFLVVKGDYSHLDGTVVGGVHELDEVLENLLYYDVDAFSDIEFANGITAWDSFPHNYYWPNETEVIVCGGVD